ncbi:MAG: hypothetical protein ACJ76J_02065 [Thermoanaerobaculia bacterium]
MELPTGEIEGRRYRSQPFVEEFKNPYPQPHAGDRGIDVVAAACYVRRPARVSAELVNVMLFIKEEQSTVRRRRIENFLSAQETLFQILIDDKQIAGNVDSENPRVREHYNMGGIYPQEMRQYVPEILGNLRFIKKREEGWVRRFGETACLSGRGEGLRSTLHFIYGHNIQLRPS